MDAFASDQINLRIGVPKGLAPLTYRILINATDGSVVRSISLIVNVSRIYDYDATCNQTIKEHTTSGATTFEIEIEDEEMIPENLDSIARVTVFVGSKVQG